MKNVYKKIKSLALVCVLLFSVMTAVMMLPNQVQAAAPGAFSITAPTAGATYNHSVTPIVNITWGTSTNATGYIIQINGAQQQNSTLTYYNWSVPSALGAYDINVSAYNATWVKTYATNNNITVNVIVYIPPIIPSIPGVNSWGDATTDLEYNANYSNVYVNSSLWSGTGPYFLYYPTYRNTGTSGYASEFTWDGAYRVGTTPGYEARVTGKSNSQIIYTGGQPISFNRSGMWIFDSNTDHSSYEGYIWVNTTSAYTIQNIADFNYESSGSITVTVNTGSDTGCMIAVVNPDNATVYHKWRAGGVSEAIKIDTVNFSTAGDYRVLAYRDFDAQNNIYYYNDEGGRFYNDTYGNTLVGVTGYNYTRIGPWDPPEKQAPEITFTVSTGKPKITLTNTSIYWGYDARIDINVTDSDGIGLDLTPNPIILKYGSTYVPFGPYITNLHKGNYSIQLDRLGAAWTALSAVIGKNINGTWKVVFGYDPNGDKYYEWNSSASFTVKSANPPVQLIIANDGSGTPTDKKVEVPAYTPTTGSAGTINIQFDIYGTKIADKFGMAYYGDDLYEDAENITVEGDILYPADTVYNNDILNPGRWTATVTPTKPGGTITITIDWPGDDNGTASQTISIVNGTSVTSAVNAFTVGKDYNLTITVKDMDDAPVKNAYVYLMWEDGNIEFNDTIGDNSVGKGRNGEYTFWIKPHSKTASTPDIAPQNITVAAQWYSHFWGYTKVIMERNHNMMVNITPTTAYAGDAVEYDIVVSLVGGGHPAASGLSVALFNETGDYVIGVDEWYKDGDYDITDEEIILSGGTYYLAAMNDTSDSKGHNATLTITKYIVTTSPSILAWIVDDAANVTFHLTPAGNGTLTLENVSSFEAAIENESTQVSIENGVGTIEGIDATTLGNVTYSYTPDGGAERPAAGLLRVTTATATPTPATIYLGEPTVVTITVTHPALGTPLEDVRVGLDHGMLLNETILAKLPTDLFTDANGQVEFSLTADASGEITIYIENETDPDNAFVIAAQARKPMTITVNPSVNEGKTFTVEARSYGTLITATPVTFTFDGQAWPTTTGIATLTAPTVPTSMTYPITATAEGYATATGAMIMVVNVPKLIIAIAGEVKAGQTFTATIADDTGGPVIGATLTFDGKTYTSGAGGVATITAPSTEGTYPVTATFPGYETLSDTVTVMKGGGIPGFELLTLIAAIGVAFLLLRRKRN